MVEGHYSMRNGIEGHKIRKVESHCLRRWVLTFLGAAMWCGDYTEESWDHESNLKPGERKPEPIPTPVLSSW